MSTSDQMKTEDKARVQVKNLPQAERELKDHEAEKVKGGRGSLLRMPGEEIPQTVD